MARIATAGYTSMCLYISEMSKYSIMYLANLVEYMNANRCLKSLFVFSFFFNGRRAFITNIPTINSSLNKRYCKFQSARHHQGIHIVDKGRSS
jgi:hypothetical protein